MNLPIHINLDQLTPLAAVILILGLIVMLLTAGSAPGQSRTRQTALIRSTTYFFMLCAATILFAALRQELGKSEPKAEARSEPAPVSTPAVKKPARRTAPEIVRGGRDVSFSGTVVDAAGQPVAQAAVEIDGFGARVITDAYGNFRLQFKTGLSMATPVLIVIRAQNRQAQYFQLAMDANNLRLRLP
ncbi:MAG: carboxypeptidase regulatory-like domain-containing protein [Saprospirales bacterium]|nr:carboxypeptidase regulatory-like domain-containing protein [Saprospirales bacterium]